MLAGLHPAPVGEEQAFPGAFEELEGAVVGFKVSAASLVRQSKRLQQLSAALSQICSRQRKPLWEIGLAFLSRTFYSCCFGLITIDAFSSLQWCRIRQIFFWRRRGGWWNQRQRGTRAPVPWLLLYQHGCSLYLATLKRTVRLKPCFCSYSTTIRRVCTQHFKVSWEDIFLPN